MVTLVRDYGPFTWRGTDPPELPLDLTALLPSVTQGHWRSPLCPPATLFSDMCPTDPDQILLQRKTSSSELHMCFRPHLSLCLPLAFSDFPGAYSSHSKEPVIRPETLASAIAGGAVCIDPACLGGSFAPRECAGTMRSIYSPRCSGPECSPSFPSPLLCSLMLT